MPPKKKKEERKTIDSSSDSLRFCWRQCREKARSFLLGTGHHTKTKKRSRSLENVSRRSGDQGGGSAAAGKQRLRGAIFSGGEAARFFRGVSAFQALVPVAGSGYRGG